MKKTEADADADADATCVSWVSNKMHMSVLQPARYSVSSCFWMSSYVHCNFIGFLYFTYV